MGIVISSQRGLIGQGNIGIHSHKERRYICHTCDKTFAATTGTPFYRRRYEAEFISQMVSLLAHGCPPQASSPPMTLMSAR
jgi:transposase-like protein